MVKRGWVFKGLKPSTGVSTAARRLAEAEVEYQDKKPPSTWPSSAQNLKSWLPPSVSPPCLPADRRHAVIWTTTPGPSPPTRPSTSTLNTNTRLSTPPRPAGADGRTTESSLKRLTSKARSSPGTNGGKLDHITFRHPFYDRLSPVFVADYVGLTPVPASSIRPRPMVWTTSTPARPTAFTNDDILNPVQSNGVYAESCPSSAGLHIWKANPVIVDKLQEVGALFSHEKISHSYMHCWRHKTPLIYRATAQWFVGMDLKPNGGPSLRELALGGVDATQFFPSWGQARLHAMIANRPDWCISRQRNWGVPIPFFLHRETGELHPRTVELMEAVAAFEQEGIAAWFSSTPPNCSAPKPASTTRSATPSTCGSTPAPPTGTCCAVPTTRRPRHRPACRPLPEGSDQHRGWFHSSLLTGCAIDGHPPYKALLTHGFAVDGTGRKMSKSLGNVVVPQEVTGKLGAEILRLWVASTDYSGELSISKEILDRVVEVYRRLRNTLRFLPPTPPTSTRHRHAAGVRVAGDRLLRLALTRKLQDQAKAD